MDMSINERRQIENEMIFRRANEKVADSIDQLDARNIEEGNPELITDDDTVLHFKCECSDENCSERIPIKLNTYQKIHENRKAFIVKLKHQVEAIEKVISANDTYNVVEKNNRIAEPSGTLNSTSVNNT